MKKIATIGVFALTLVFGLTSSVSAQVGYGGGGGGGSSRRATPAVPATPANPGVNPATPATPGIPNNGRVLGATTSTFTQNLGQGASSATVRQLQESLRAKGFFTFPTSTGFFGPITLSAVRAFQTANNIPATGFVGPLTIAALNK